MENQFWNNFVKFLGVIMILQFTGVTLIVHGFVPKLLNYWFGIN